MTRSFQTSRRGFLLGASAALLFAGRAGAQAGLGGRKLIVVVARGGMDGLSATVPYGDRDYAPLRGALAIPPPGAAGGALKIDGTFGLHPSLDVMHRLALAGEMRFAPAVAIPDRQRSHFEAQDVLESGASRLYGATSGWMNRALGAMGGASGLSVGSQVPLILRGPARAAAWAPGGKPARNDQVATVLQDLYKDDALLGPALASGLATEAMVEAAAGGESLRRTDARAIGDAAGRLMTQPGGADLVALSLDGFDTHARQGASTGLLARRLDLMDGLHEGLKAGLGDSWQRTVVVTVTEFGRTARANGTGGTDHGTASTAFLAGGALRKGGIVGDWPTLAESRLFEGRDLEPTLDVRSIFKGLLRDHMGVDRAALDSRVFENSAGARPVESLVA